MAGASVGTVFKISSTTVGQLKSIGGVECSADTIDVTSLDSTGGYREFVAGFKNGGEVALSGFFKKGDAGQSALNTAFGTGTLTSFSITFPTAISASWAFSGVVTKFGTSAEVEGAVQFDAAVKVSGAPTLS